MRPPGGGLDVLLQASLPSASAETRQVLETTARTETRARGEPLQLQGAVAPLTLVLAGYAIHRRTTPEGRSIDTWVVTRGHLCGITGLAASPAAFDVLALTECTTACWAPEPLRVLASRDAGLAAHLLDVAIRVVTSLAGRIDDFAYQDPRRRAARLILEYAALLDGTDPVIPPEHFAALTGTSREMTGRVLRTLESAGLLSRVGRGLIVIDPAGLRRLAFPPGDSPGEGASDRDDPPPALRGSSAG